MLVAAVRLVAQASVTEICRMEKKFPQVLSGNGNCFATMNVLRTVHLQ